MTTIGRYCSVVIAIAAPLPGCTPPITGLWTIEQTTVTADFIGCDQKAGQQTGTAFDIGQLALFEDGTYRVESRYEIVAQEVYIRWPFDPLEPAITVDGHWTLEEASNAVSIEDHAVLGLVGAWQFAFAGEDLLLSGSAGGTIFEPCSTDAKTVTHRLTRPPE